jgi:hypothetical protein
MADDKVLMTLTITQDEEGNPALKSSGPKNAQMYPICLPLAILVDKMLTCLDENPEALMSDLENFSNQLDEEVNDG